jgi:hypothetical protein
VQEIVLKGGKDRGLIEKDGVWGYSEGRGAGFLTGWRPAAAYFGRRGLVNGVMAGRSVLRPARRVRRPEGRLPFLGAVACVGRRRVLIFVN